MDLHSSGDSGGDSSCSVDEEEQLQLPETAGEEDEEAKDDFCQMRLSAYASMSRQVRTLRTSLNTAVQKAKGR